MKRIALIIGILLPFSLVVEGCGKRNQGSEVFGFVRGDSAVTTQHFEALGLGVADTVIIFQTWGSDLVVVEWCDGERQTLHEKWLNPVGYERKDCEDKL